jgi:hypothetical protein
MDVYKKFIFEDNSIRCGNRVTVTLCTHDKNQFLNVYVPSSLTLTTSEAKLIRDALIEIYPLETEIITPVDFEKIKVGDSVLVKAEVTLVDNPDGIYPIKIDIIHTWLDKELIAGHIPAPVKQIEIGSIVRAKKDTSISGKVLSINTKTNTVLVESVCGFWDLFDLELVELV